MIPLNKPHSLYFYFYSYYYYCCSFKKQKSGRVTFSEKEASLCDWGSNQLTMPHSERQSQRAESTKAPMTLCIEARGDTHSNIENIFGQVLGKKKEGMSKVKSVESTLKCLLIPPSQPPPLPLQCKLNWVIRLIACVAVCGIIAKRSDFGSHFFLIVIFFFGHRKQASTLLLLLLMIGICESDEKDDYHLLPVCC